MAGSLQYWPRRRAHRRLPRIRSAGIQKDVAPSNIVAYKVGMATVSMLDDSDAPSKGQEVIRACTALECPPMEVYAIRFYKKDPATRYTKTYTEVADQAIAKKLGIKNAKDNEAKLLELEKNKKGITDIALIIAAYPKTTSTGVHHAERFEARLTGDDIEQKFAFAKSKLGKEIHTAEIFKPGEFVDVASVSKGKGWQGPIKRFGISRMNHKATEKIRHVGALGAYSPGKVMYTVPMPGQMGFNYRTEHNKRIIKIGAKAEAQEVNASAGFKNYGFIKNDYILIEGSVPGPSKRIVRIKKSVENRNSHGIKEPKISYISK